MDFLINVLTWLAVAGVIVLLTSGVASRYKKVPPNTALIVYGGGHAPRLVKGGGVFVWPIRESVDSLDLSLIELPVSVKEVPSIQGVKITVQGIAQIKISSDDDKLRSAAEKLLGKSRDQIVQTAIQTLDGHLRAIVGTLTVEEIIKEREKFSAKSKEVADTDLGGMGLSIVSFVITNVTDGEGYIDALGKPQIAEVTKRAALAAAEADRETRKGVASARREAETAEIEATVKVAEAAKERDLKVAEYNAVSRQAQAKADKAYDLELAEQNVALAQREGAVATEKQRQDSAAAEQAIAVAQRRAEAQTVVPARAQKEASVSKAEGEAQATKLQASAQAEQIRATRTAEAEGVRAIGLAQAESERANLLARAEGEKQLADARSANEGVNLVQFALERLLESRVEQTRATAQAIAAVSAKWHVVQFASGNGSSGGNAVTNNIRELIQSVPEMAAMVDALSGGKGVGGLIEEVTQLVKEAQQAVHTSEDAPTTPNGATLAKLATAKAGEGAGG